jgi:serine protease Do
MKMHGQTVGHLSALMVVAALAVAPSGNLPAAEPDVRRDATVQAVEQVMPSVVNIATRTIVPVSDPFEEMYRRFWGRQSSDALISLGSGVIVDEAGYLLTNDHVVRRAQKIQVQFNDVTNVTYDATVVASDPRRDIALLKINGLPGQKFHAIKLAREDDLLLGETVLALGNPFGLGGTVTRGILSSKIRSMPKEGSSLGIPNWLQTDAPINAGNSGGPLVNLRGELIGINVAVLSEMEGRPVQGIGFAVPIRAVQEALSDIFPTESVKSYWFGARVKVGTAPLAITSVQPDSPAGRAGLRAGDEILQVNGAAPTSFIDFADRLAANPASDVRLTIQRGLNRIELSVRLVPEKTVFNSSVIQEKLGLNVEPLTPETAARFAVDASDGFLITSVDRNGPAGAKHLTSGMALLAVDDQSAADVTALAKLLYGKRKGDSVRLDLVVLQRAGDFNIVRPGSVKVEVR